MKEETKKMLGKLFGWFFGIFILGGIIWIFAHNKPAKEKNDYNCSDFSSQKEAQRFFEEHGGPNNDYYGLDRDKDGIVCESLK